MTQKEKILQYLKDHGTITTREAFLNLGVTRLASRIWDLRNDGYNIIKEMIQVKNRDGETCTVAQYRLEG